MPLSLTADDDLSVASLRAVSEIRPPASVYFAALLSRLAKTWARRVGSASTQIGSGGSVDRQRVAGPLDERPARFDGVVDDRRQLDPLPCGARACRG